MTTLYLVWREPGQRWWPVGRLSRLGEVYVFAYTHGAQLAHAAGFRPLVGFPDMRRVYKSATLFPVFQNRLFPKNRPEYVALQRWADLVAPDGADPLVVLARTLGPRVTDMFEVFAKPQVDELGRYSAVFFAHGLAHRSPAERAAARSLAPGSCLALEADPDNAVDPSALRVITPGGAHVGFVPRYLSRDVNLLQQSCPGDGPSVSVRRVNLDAPPQFLLLCTLHSCWPTAFEPCSQAEYQTLGADAEVEHLTIAQRAVI